MKNKRQKLCCAGAMTCFSSKLNSHILTERNKKTFEPIETVQQFSGKIRQEKSAFSLRNAKNTSQSKI